MNKEQLIKLMNNLTSLNEETEVVEFKENNSNPEEIGKNISALSNSACLLNKKRAYLVFGVQDGTHEITGTLFKPNSEKKGGELIERWLNKMLSPKIDFQIHTFLFKEKNIVLFEIFPATTQPIKFKSISYIRIASCSMNLNNYPEKERKIWQNIDKKSFEKGIAKEGVNVSTVLELLDYSKFFSLTKQNLPSETSKFVDKMKEHGLVIKNFKNDYDITNLGAILFAKNLEKFSSIKRKAVRVVVYKGDSRVEIKKSQDGYLGYAIAFENLIEYILDKLPSNEEITNTFREKRKMYPSLAIREFIANALIHQDFTISGTGPLIEIFDNRVEITNKGIPLIDTDRFIDHAPISRNAELANFMRQVGFCEELGSGIDRALIKISIYQLPAPKFEVGDNFTRITLYAHKKLSNMTTDDKVRACYQHAVLKWIEGKRMTNKSLRERLGIPKTNYPAASKIISETVKQAKIKESAKSKEYTPFWT